MQVTPICLSVNIPQWVELTNKMPKKKIALTFHKKIYKHKGLPRLAKISPRQYVLFTNELGKSYIYELLSLLWGTTTLTWCHFINFLKGALGLFCLITSHFIANYILYTIENTIKESCSCYFTILPLITIMSHFGPILHVDVQKAPCTSIMWIWSWMPNLVGIEGHRWSKKGSMSRSSSSQVISSVKSTSNSCRKMACVDRECTRWVSAPWKLLG